MSDTPTPATRDNLIAARALIDTPEKYEAARKLCGTAIGYALMEIGGSHEGELPMRNVIGQVWRYGDGFSFDAAMALFDRAIASQENQS